MRILITGANSLLGKSLWESSPPNTRLILTDNKSSKFAPAPLKTKQMDVTNRSNVFSVIKQVQPTTIIHLAAFSDVDKCQKDPKKAQSINIEGTRNVTDAAEKNHAKIVFTSTNAVFDGNHAPYSEQDTPNPLHIYGESKYQAEKLVAKAKIQYIITRLITMFGWPPNNITRHNPVTWSIKKLRENEKISMVNDKFINPLYAPAAADAVWKLISANAGGIFHIAGKSRVSRYTWTVKIAKVFGLKTSLIKSVPSTYFKHLTPRPNDTTYITEKLQRTIKWKPIPLNGALTDMKMKKSINS